MNIITEVGSARGAPSASKWGTEKGGEEKTESKPDEDYFSEIFVEDALCPIENDFDVNLAVSNSPNTEISNNETTTVGTGGCSLTHQKQFSQNPVTTVMAILFLCLMVGSKFLMAKEQ